jgi:hypothetical protein
MSASGGFWIDALKEYMNSHRETVGSLSDLTLADLINI